jgi:hypothetical protein
MMLRGGFGVFYDVGNGQGAIGFNGFPFSASRSVTNVFFPLVPAVVAPPPPVSLNPPFSSEVISFDPNLKLPYTLQWNFGVEQSLGSNQTLSVSYVAALGRRLLVQQRLNLATINPNFNTIRLITNDSTSDYHSLQVQFQRRLSRGIQALASYTWAHAIDTASVDDFSSSRPIIRGNADFDIRHSFAAAITYDLPKPKNEGIGLLLRDWSLDTRINAQSALPFNVTSGTLIDLTTRTQVARRANLIAGVPIYLSNPNVPGGRVVNRNAFSIPATGQQGSLGRNVIRGFGSWQADVALRRQFNVTETVKIQFRAEAFNIFNHPNFGTIQNSLTATNFGVALNMLGRQLSPTGGLNPLYQIGGPRSMQFALRVHF